MLLTVSVALGIIAALLSGGRLTRLAKPGFRALWLPIAGCALQLIELSAYRFWGVRLPRSGVVALSYGLSFAFLWLNRRYPLGSGVSAVGALMNLTVIAANGFHMPVSEAALAEGGERIGYIVSDQARLMWLGDVIRVPIPIFGGMMSVGDIFIALGAGLLCFAAMRRAEA